MSGLRAGLGDVAVLTAIHAAGFSDPWTAEAFAVLLTQPGVMALMHGAPAGGFILVRAVADEAEILTIAVLPEMRRQGVGAALIAEAVRILGQGHTRRLFLEVAADNVSALALYESSGFSVVGQRAGYYARPAGAVDAVIMARPIPPFAP